MKTQKVKPGKGGAYNQVELKNVITGTKLNQRFRSDEAVEEIYLEKKDFQFLYANGDMLTFMDMETYDQIELPADFVGDRRVFLQDGMKTLVQLYEGRPIGIKLPVQVTLEVAEADPVMRGGTAAPSYKSAVLENGMKIQVPPFIDAGDEDRRRHRRRLLRPAGGIMAYLSPALNVMTAAARKAGRAADPRFRRTGKSADLDERARPISSPAPTSAPNAS